MSYAIISALALAAIVANFADWQFSSRKGQLMRLRSGGSIFGLAYLFAAVFSLFYLFGVLSVGVVSAVVSVIVVVHQIFIILERHRYAA